MANFDITEEKFTAFKQHPEKGWVSRATTLVKIVSELDDSNTLLLVGGCFDYVNVN